MWCKSYDELIKIEWVLLQSDLWFGMRYQALYVMFNLKFVLIWREMFNS